MKFSFFWLHDIIPGLFSFFQIIKSSIGFNLSTDDIKEPSSLQNGVTNSFVSGITTPFLFSEIVPNDPSFRISTQYQFSKHIPSNFILFEGTNILSIFNHKLFSNNFLWSNSTQECSVTRFVKDNTYLNIVSNNIISTYESLISDVSEAQVKIPKVPSINHKLEVIKIKYGIFFL